MAWVRFRRSHAEPVVARLINQDDPPVVSYTGTPAVSTGKASTKPGVSAQLGHVISSYLAVVILTGLIAFWFYDAPDNPAALQGEALLAVGLFLAQGLERFLDPFSRWAGATSKETVASGGASTGKDKDKLVAARDGAFAAAFAAGADTAPEDEQKAADAQAALDQFRANAAVVLWAAGCVLGVTIAAMFDLRLLSAVGARAAAEWDVAISGIAIGSATKPLHDLVEALKAIKKKNDGAPSVTGAV